MATLKELSERTGYSTATISRVLNGDESFSVPEEVKRSILEEADKANYRQTRSRRGRTPKSLLRIGIAEMLTPAQQLDDPYYLYLGNYVRQVCMDKKYVCIPLEARADVFVLPRVERLDGIVAIGYFSIAQIDSLAKLSSNVVFIDSSPFESKFDSVVVGYELGVSLALEFLVKLGHKRIGFVGPVWKFNDRRQDALEVRRQLFIKRMEARKKYDPALLILGMGLIAFIVDTAGGVLFAKLLNVFSKKKINPMIGAAGISAFPMSGRIVHKMALEEDPQNFLLMHSIGVNVSGQIASVIAGGIILNLFS